MTVSDVAAQLIGHGIVLGLCTVMCKLIFSRRGGVLQTAWAFAAIVTAILLTLAAAIEISRSTGVVDRACGARLSTVFQDCSRIVPCPCESTRRDSILCPAMCPNAPTAPRIIWTYLHEGRPWSSPNVWIRTAWQSWQMHAAANGYTIRALNQTEAIRQNVRYPIPTWVSRLPWNHQGDFVSFALLLEHGGMYLDSDTLLVNNPDSLLDHTARYEFVAFDHFFTGKCSSGHHHGFMASRPDSAALRMYYINMIRFFEDRHGCMGSTCASKLDTLSWLDTLNFAFDGDSKQILTTDYRPRSYDSLVLSKPCSVLRLWYHDYEWNENTKSEDHSDRAPINQACLLGPQWNVSSNRNSITEQIISRIARQQLVVLHMSPLKHCADGMEKTDRVAEALSRMQVELWHVLDSQSAHASASSYLSKHWSRHSHFKLLHFALTRALFGVSSNS